MATRRPVVVGSSPALWASLVAGDTLIGIQSINNQTGTSYTVQSSDGGKIVTLSNASAIAVAIAVASSFGAGWYVELQNIGASQVTITPTTSTIDGAASFVLGPRQGVKLLSDGTNYFTMRGWGVSLNAPSFTGGISVTGNSTFSADISAATINSQKLSNGGQTNSLVVGAGSSVVGTNSTAVGSGASTSTAATDATVLGYSATSAASYSVALGRSATVGSTGTGAIAIGHGSNASGSYSLAIGYGAVAAGGGFALGGNANASVTTTGVAIGRNAAVSVNGQVVFGAANLALNDIYFGTGVTDANAPVTVTLQPTGGSGTDSAGDDFVIAGGRNTGTAAAGNIYFKTSAPAGSSNSTLQALAERMRITPTGVGIGNVNPTTTLHVNGNSLLSGNVAMGGAALDTNYILIAAQNVTDPASAKYGAGFQRGLVLSATNANNVVGGNFTASYITGTAAYTGTLIGGSFTASHNTLATVSNAVGGQFLAYNTSTGTITNACAAQFNIQNLNASGTIGTAYGAYVGGGFNNGTITTLYGIYVDSLPSAGTKYGLFIKNTTSWFGGAAIVAGGSGTNTNGAGCAALVGGYGSPVSGRLLMGDGTGWRFNISKGVASSPSDLFVFTDGAKLGVGGAPSYDIHIRNAVSPTILIDDNATRILKIAGPSATSSAIISSYSTLYLGGSLDAQHLMITSAGRVGIGTSTADSPLSISGSSVNIGTYSNTYRNLLSFATSNSATGTICIYLPQLSSTTMMTVKISGYDYSGSGAWEIIVGGYNYFGNSWHNTTWCAKGRPPFKQVRLSSTSTNDVILLGNTSTSWNYCRVDVTEFIGHYNNFTSGWGTGWSAALLSSEVSITGAMYTASGPDIIVDSSGRVGIRTVAQIAALDVGGTAQKVPNLSDSGAFGGTVNLYDSDAVNGVGSGGTLLFSSASANGNRAQAAIKSLLTNGNGNGIGDLVFSTRNATGDSTLTERLRILSSGKVGVSTASPQSIFEAKDTTAGTTVIRSIGNANGFTIISDGLSDTESQVNIGVLYSSAAAVVGYMVKPSGTASSYVSSCASAQPRGAIEVSNITRFLTATPSTVAVGSAVTMTETMRIDGSGFVGIGTTNLQDRLNVAGGIVAASNINIGDSQRGFWIDAWNSFTYGIGKSAQGTSATLDLYANGAVRLQLDPSGNARLASSAYFNFGTTFGSTGYGVRDNAGTIELKNSGGAWAAPISAASPALTGTPTAPTAAVNTNTTQIATTAFVVGQASSASPLVNGVAAVGTSLRYAREDHVHATDTTRAPLASPSFTGTVTTASDILVGGRIAAGSANGSSANWGTAYQALFLQGNYTGGGSQSGPYSCISVTDTTSTTNANHNALSVLYIAHNINAGAGIGSRFSVQPVTIKNVNTGGTAPADNFFLPLFPQFYINSGNGGSGPSTYYGDHYGFGSLVQAQTGATWLNSVTGAEVDVSMQTGSNAKYKVGLQIISVNSDAVAADSWEAMLLFTRDSTTTATWKNGIIFGAPYGLWPFSSTSTLIGSWGSSLTAGIGIDLSSIAFTTAAIKANNFTLDNAGNLQLLSVQTNGTVSAGGASGGLVALPRTGSGTNYQWYNPSGNSMKLFGSADMATFSSAGSGTILNLGAGDSASPAAQYLTVQGVVAGTTNTAGVDFTIRGSASTGNVAGGAIVFQLTSAGASGTAQNAYSNVLSLNASDFSTRTSGPIYIPNATNLGARNAANSGWVSLLYLDASNVLQFAASGNTSVFGGPVQLNSTLAFSTDLFLTRKGAAVLQHGAADAAAPVAQYLTVQSVVAGTTNTAGQPFTIRGSAGTGTGVGGNVVVQLTPAGSTGSAQNAYSNVLSLNASDFSTQTFGPLYLPNATNFAFRNAANSAWVSAMYLDASNVIQLGAGAAVKVNSALTLAAGTTTLAPVTFPSGSLLTTAAAGVVEYDGSVFYASPKASNRGLMKTVYVASLSSSYTLTSQTAAQKLFNTSTNGAITLDVGTYWFECSFTLSSMSASSGSFGFALGGTATKTEGWQANAMKVATLSGADLDAPVANTPNLTYQTGAQTTLVTANTNTNAFAYIEGFIRITVAGTIIPQVSLGVAAAAVVGANSYFKIVPVSGSATGTNIGNWS